MKIKNLSSMRKLMLLLLSVFAYAGAVTAQSVSMSINNCAVTAPNEIQFDVTATNLTAANVLHWNSVVIRLTYSTGFLASTSDAVVWGYVGNSDFPLSLPPSANPTFTSNPTLATKLQLQTGAGIYNNATCTAPAILPGATAKIGRFFLRDNTANFVAGQSVGLTWITSSGLVLYLDCATTVTNYNTAGTRTLNPPCSLTIPAGCTSPTLNISPSDQSICTSGTATFTGSFNGGSPVPTLIWQVQTGGAGPFTDLTETAPYSGTATGTLTITNPTLSLSSNRYRLRANNTCGDVFANTTGALLTVSAPPNAGAVSGTSPVCINNTVTYSSNGDAGGTWSSTNTGVATVNASSGVVTTLSSGTSDITYTVGSSCTTAAFKTISVSSFTTLAGVAGGAQVCSNVNVLPGGSSFSDASCNLIAKVVPSGGATAVNGNINVCVRVEDVVHTYQNSPYVQRVYDIEPATNAATATATITLYYTQAEFDAYNLARGANPAIPGGPVDPGGVNNIRITQYHGTGTYPGNYNGSVNPVLIDPLDANIIWNAGSNRWEMTFDVNGFSGFYLSSKVVVLPITLLNFSGKNNGNYNVLNWTTSSEQNSSYFDLLRSTDGINFVKVSTINAAGNSSVSKNYNYNDDIISINNNIYYYKLKMVDVTGSIKYSATVKIKLNSKGFNVEVTPNPFTDQIKINIETPLSEKAIISLKDISGRKLRQMESSLRQGNNALQLTSLGNIPSGVYLLTITTDTEQQTIKIIKQ
jgi:hypothetical protein